MAGGAVIVADSIGTERLLGWRAWAAYVVVGAAAGLLCLLELRHVGVPAGAESAAILFLALVGIAMALAAPYPGAALVASWGAALVQLIGGLPLMVTELSLVVVVFSCARWGRTVTVIGSGASIVVLPLLARAWAMTFGIDIGARGWLLVDWIGSHSGTVPRTLVLLGIAVFAIPWTGGLALRFLARARAAQDAQREAELHAEQADEIARLRDEQNRLARDVHDVVGHSLAVILAQAESAQFVDESDPARLKETMATIATSARASLQDVRQVLAPSRDDAVPRTAGLDALIDGVRGSGHLIEDRVIGPPRPLPPELQTVAYRVLQEMLTNAMRHGRREAPIRVEREWPGPAEGIGALRIEVTNQTPLDDGATVALDTAPGQGVDGMRRRLASVGGTFEVRRDAGPDGERFSATAWLPVRDQGAATRG